MTMTTTRPTVEDDIHTVQHGTPLDVVVVLVARIAGQLTRQSQIQT